MSAHASPDRFHDDLLADGFAAPRAGEDDIGVRFPPGLGIIPPRELARQPRARREMGA